MFIENRLNVSNKFFVYLTSLYIITWYLQLNGRVSILNAIRFEFLLGSALIILGFFYHNKSVSKKNPLLLFVIIYFISLLIQIPFSYDRLSSWDFFFNRVFKFSMLAFFIIKFINDPWALRIFIFAYLLACFKLGQEGFLGWITGSLVWQNQGIDRLHGSISILAHPNSFSGFAVGTLPFIFYLFNVFNSKLIKVFLIVLLLFSTIIILYTGSRTGYVGACGTIAFIVWRSKNKYKKIFIILLSLPIVIQFVPEQYVGRFESIFTGQDKVGQSTNKRLQILEDAVEVFKIYPFGVGIHAFPAVRRDLFGREQDTHNLYLEILTNLGVQGFIIFFILILSLFKLLNKLRSSLENQANNLTQIDSYDKGGGDNELRHHLSDIKFLLAIVNAVAAFVFARLILGLFGMDLYEIYWWLAIGLTITVFKMNELLEPFTKKYLI